MAFPASKGVLSQTLDNACARALWVKQVAQHSRDTLAAGNVAANRIIDLDSQFRTARAELVVYGATPGIAAAAQEEFNDPELDVAAEWQAMISAIDGVTTWIRTNFPVGTGSAAGYLLAQTWGAAGPVWREFTPAHTAGLRTALDALIATVA